MRRALASARRRIEESLGPEAQVGPVSAGGFEVVTPDEDAEEQISEAMSESVMDQESVPGLRITENGLMVADQPSVDGSMLGL